MFAIETKDLSKKYRSRAVVDSVNLSVPAGSVFGYLGPNGSGKTTTIGMLFGVVSPTSGTFALLGGIGEPESIRTRVGGTLELACFYPYMSCRQNLVVSARRRGVPLDQVDACLELSGLQDRRNTRFKECSLGMKQRLALANTLLSDPDLLILDEPTNGLDPEGMREIREIIAHLSARGKTIFLSTHLLGEVERLCTHVAVLSRGRIVFQGTVAEFGNTHQEVRIRGRDLDRIRDRARLFPRTTSVTIEDGVVVVRVESCDPEDLCRFMTAGRVFFSHFAVSRLESAYFASLEEDRTQAARQQ